jgi:hypothetical protein
VTSPGATGSGTSWADTLEATVTALRDVRTMILELHERAAVLGETIDELVARVVDEHAEEIRLDRQAHAATIVELAAVVASERDPVTAALDREKLP